MKDKVVVRVAVQNAAAVVVAAVGVHITRCQAHLIRC